MILISHRGNLTGKNPKRENHPDYIKEAILKGFQVEIDIWFDKNRFKLGHDFPQYEFSFDLIRNHSDKLWIHCKNLDAISQLNELDRKGIYINYFWHQNDDVTLTSKGYLWAYPGKNVNKSIAVLPEIYNDNLKNRIGICSDEILKYKNGQKK
jgi:hypothetical protein